MALQGRTINVMSLIIKTEPQAGKWSWQKDTWMICPAGVELLTAIACPGSLGIVCTRELARRLSTTANVAADDEELVWAEK